MPDPTVGRDSRQLSFVRVRPGQESSFAKRLAVLGDDVASYKIFGAYDFAILRTFHRSWPETDWFPSNLGGSSTLDHFSLTCFEWDMRIPSSRGRTAKRRAPMIAIVFLKIRDDLVARSGVEVEVVIATELKHIFRRAINKGITVQLLGTLGWFEAILLVEGRRLGDMVDTVLGARSIRGVSGGAKPAPLFKSTVTVPGIRLSKGGPLHGGTFDGLSVRLSATCTPGADDRIQSALSQHFGSPAFVLGGHDYAVDLDRPQSSDQYVRALWSFRRSHARDLYRTVTTISSLETVPGETDSPALEETGRPKVATPSLSRLKARNEVLASAVKETSAYLTDVCNDPLTWSAMADVVPFANALMRSIQADVPPYSNPETVAQQLEILNFGIGQRSLGALPFDVELGTRSALGAPRGIQRLTRAASAIPSLALSQLRMKWDGFVAFGFARDYHRYLGGVISMPWESLFDLKRWLLCYHEVGHECGAVLDVTSDPNLIAALESAGMYTSEAPEFAWEVFSEMLGCLLAYGADRWDEYVKDSWEYLCDHEKMADVEGAVNFFSRFLLVELYMRRRKGKLVKTKRSVARIGAELYDKVSGYCPAVQNIDGRLDAVYSSVTRLLPALDVLASLIPECPALEEKTIDEARQILSKGKLPRGKYPPAVILQAIRRVSGESEFRASISGVLELWHLSVTSGARE